jgi:hypothetical protein
MTSPTRVYLDDFALANPLYQGATVTVFLADPVTFEITSNVATLYSDLTSATQIGNPQTLDGDGKWLQPVYVDAPVIMQVTNASVASHATGVAGPLGGYQGPWAPNTVYNGGDSVQDGPAGSDSGNLYYCVRPHTSSSSFAADLTAGDWIVQLDLTPFIAAIAAQVSGSWVQRGGDTMTGPLVLSGAPSTGLQAATKTYVDNGDATTAAAAAAAQATATAALPKTGGIMGGLLFELNTPQAHGAKGDGATDDSAAFAAWLAWGAVNGGGLRIPAASYVIASALTISLAGKSLEIVGDGFGCTTLLFTGNTDGFTFNLSRSGGVWGGARISRVRIERIPTSPAQAHTAISFIADPTAGTMYNGPVGLRDVFISGPGSSQSSGWQVGVYISSVVLFDFDNCNFLGPTPSGAGSDCAIWINGSSASMYCVQTNLTDTSVTGFSCGIYVTGYVQGVFVENGAIIGNWWGINAVGISPPTTVPTTAGASVGATTIYVSPANAAILKAGDFSIINGTGLAPQTGVTSTSGVLNINTSTGAIQISPAATGTVSNGESLSFQTSYVAEALQVTGNTTFNATYRDILVSWYGFVQIVGASMLQFGTTASDFAGIDCEECNNVTIAENQIIGSVASYNAHTPGNGIIVSSAGGQGSFPVTIQGNCCNGFYGYGVTLGSAGRTVSGSTVSNASVTGNNFFAVLDGVAEAVPNQLGPNIINGNPKFSTSDGVLTVGSSAATYSGLTMKQASGGGNVTWAQGDASTWIMTGTPTNWTLNRYQTPGTLTDTPITVDNATGGVKVKNGMSIFNQPPLTGAANITGSRSSNTADVLEQVLQQLQSFGLVQDSTTT